eukprot:115915_1
MHDAVDLLQRQIEKAITAGDLSGLPSADALEVVVSTFQTVLEQITIEHESDQETMSATSDAASECSTSMTRVNGSLGNVSVRRTEHKTCRGGEDDALHSENVACTLMRTRVLAAHTAAEETIGSCPRSSWDASTEDAGAAAMLSCFKQVKAWLEGHYSALNSSKHECDSKAAEAVAKASECDNAQKTFESMFCQYAMAQESLCAEQSLCRALRVSYNQTMIRESSRKILWTAATHGICLVQVVRTAKERNITQTDLDGCLHSPANTTNLTISYPAEMAHVSTIATKCAEVGDLKRPGDAEWESVEYAGLSHLDDVMPCATPPTALLPTAAIELQRDGSSVAWGAGLRPATSAATQKWHLRKCSGTEASSCLGDAAAWTSTTSAIVSGDVVAWVSESSGKVYDCAYATCSQQRFPPPRGHWGTPFRIFKVDSAGRRRLSAQQSTQEILFTSTVCRTISGVRITSSIAMQTNA